MTETLIEYVFYELKQLGCCTSRSDFSTQYLGANEAYYRSCVCRKELIGVQAQAHLAATLRSVGMCFAKSSFVPVQDKGAALLGMFPLVLEDLFQRVTLYSMRLET